MISHFVSAIGFVAYAGMAWLFSSNRKVIPWRTVAWGLGLQLIFGLLVFRLPFSRQIFLWLNDVVLALLNATKNGSTFLFGPLAAGPGESSSIGFILAFQVLPVVIFFSALTAVLHHLRLLQPVVRLFAKIFHRSLRISGAEALCGASNIFVGGIAAIAPSRRDELASLGLRALLAATLATLMTACVAGMFGRGEALVDVL